MCAVKTGVFERISAQAVMLLPDTTGEALMKFESVAMAFDILPNQLRCTRYTCREIPLLPVLRNAILWRFGLATAVHLLLKISPGFSGLTLLTKTSQDSGSFTELSAASPSTNCQM